MKPERLFDEFVAGFPARKFSAGLLIAFIDLYLDLEIPGAGVKGLDALLARFPRQATTAGGKRANTLIVARPDGSTISLRPYYNAIERFFRAEHQRFDYPSCAPHATQAWADYQPWLDALTTYSALQLRALRQRVAQYVLDTLKSQAFDPASVDVSPPQFRLLLDEFDMTAKTGEPTGAAFQGMVFGFLRADNPHLQVEIDKVRTGSKRLQRVGDIDGWEGERLAITAEVKQRELKIADVDDLAGFANACGRRGALGLVFALAFQGNARQVIDASGLKTLDVADMLRIVELWDPLKQRTAVASLVYYARHVEKNAALTDRIKGFLAAVATRGETAVPPPL